MRIDVIQLENIRSHVKSTVLFTRGFNCLVGALGSGKSSILYAIDFALFGDPVGRSFEYLLREGADSGSITLQFTQNTRTYLLTRGLRRRGKGICQEVEALKLCEDEKLLASMKTDAVTEQLKSITGLDRDLWRGIVWVRQEHLKELLDAAHRDRQRRLDELFGLSDYEIAWNNIAVYQRDYEKERKYLETDPDITGLEKLGAEYNRVTEKFALLEIELQDAASSLSYAKRALDDADQKLKKLEETRVRVEDLMRKETRIQTSLVHNKEVLASLTTRVDGKKALIEDLKQRGDSIEEQKRIFKDRLEQTGLDANQSSDALRSCLSVFEDKLLDLKGDQEATSRNMQADQKRSASLSLENRCPLCLQLLTKEYKDSLLCRIQEENDSKEKKIHDLQTEIESVQRTKNMATEAFSNLQQLNSRGEDITTRLFEEEKNLASLITELGAKRQLENELNSHLNALRTEICRFNLSDFDTARSKREQAFKRYYLIESDLRTKENTRRDLLSRMDEIKERVDRAQEKTERMEKINKTIELIAAIRDAYRSIQPRLRGEFVKVLRTFVQQVLDGLVGEAPLLNVAIDDSYTPYVKSESGIEREVANLSGGERTLLAFAYRLGLGQLIMQSRTGHGLSMLLLDEPTESLGREDGSIDRLAEAISRFKAIEQIIAVTHSEAFAEKAEHVITLEKEAGISKVSIER